MALQWCLVRSIMGATLVFGLSMVAGCDGGPATESVSGKLTMKGEPVNGGIVTFASVSEGGEAAAEPADAPVNADGTFVVTKGAIAGRHRVSYYPPSVDIGESKDWDGKGARPQVPTSPYQGTKVEPAEVEVKTGKNELTLELVPATGR